MALPEWIRQCPLARNASRIGRGTVLEGRPRGACRSPTPMFCSTRGARARPRRDAQAFAADSPKASALCSPSAGGRAGSGSRWPPKRSGEAKVRVARRRAARARCTQPIWRDLRVGERLGVGVDRRARHARGAEVREEVGRRDAARSRARGSRSARPGAARAASVEAKRGSSNRSGSVDRLADGAPEPVVARPPSRSSRPWRGTPGTARCGDARSRAAPDRGRCRSIRWSAARRWRAWRRTSGRRYARPPPPLLHAPQQPRRSRTRRRGRKQKSEIGTPHLTGAPPGSPVTLMTPLIAWIVRSKPPSPARAARPGRRRRSSSRPEPGLRVAEARVAQAQPVHHAGPVVLDHARRRVERRAPRATLGDPPDPSGRARPSACCG